MNYDKPELRDRLASEYVLGTLHGRARRRFRRLMQDDPALRAAVEFWERELMPMAAPLSAPMPSPELWSRVAARVAPAPRGAPQKQGFARWLERWLDPRFLGALATGLFLGVGVSLVVPPMLDRGDDGAGDMQLPASYAGILSDANGHPAMLVSSRRHGRIVDTKALRAIGLGKDQVLQLWALPTTGAPVSLGVVPAQGKGRIELPATSDQLLANVTELAVTVAPKDAAPTAAPSGAFILRGPCAKFW
jgi:anti-sigma-K factor RskA